MHIANSKKVFSRLSDNITKRSIWITQYIIYLQPSAINKNQLLILTKFWPAETTCMKFRLFESDHYSYTCRRIGYWFSYNFWKTFEVIGLFTHDWKNVIWLSLFFAILLAQTFQSFLRPKITFSSQKNWNRYLFLRSTTFSCVNTFLRDDMNKNEEAKTLQRAYTSLKVLFLLSCHFRAITNRHFLFIKEAMRRNVCISVILTLSKPIMHMAQY